MYKDKAISVYLPCYNEEESVGQVLASIPAFVDEVVVVDNNSQDKSAEIAHQKGAKVVKEKQQGYGAAHKRGTQSVSGEIVCTGDADGSYPFHQLGKILDFFIDKNCDFVSACRFPLSNPSAMTATSKLGNLLLTYAIKFLFDYSFHDSQSGMWCYRREVLPKLAVSSDGMAYSQEIKLKALRHPAVKFAEIHIDYQPRLGQNKLSPLRDGLANLVHLTRYRLNLDWDPT